MKHARIERLSVRTALAIGFCVTLAYCILGLGAIALAIYNRMRSAPALPAEPAPVAV